MSAVNMDFHIEFKDELKILKSAGIHGNTLFNDKTSDVDITDFKTHGDKAMRFHVWGGAIGDHLFARTNSRLCYRVSRCIT